jgi:predicted AAA+ superfamily ATPase
VLVASGIACLLQPYSRNAAARAVKTPKLYFLDTGLVAYLCKWTSPETLESGAMSGQVFETYVVSEIMKSYQNAGLEPPLTFYRDAERREIDLVFERDGVAYPLEIKKTSSPNANDARHFNALPGAGPGGIACTYEAPVKLGDQWVIPVGFI